MAIYHLNARGCSPSTGAGAVRKAAYQSGQALGAERRKLADERARLAGEDTAPRRPEQRHRGPKH